jgi:hypothetical protein
MARLGGVCWNACADLAASSGVARRDTAIAMVGETVRRERRSTSAGASSAHCPPVCARFRLVGTRDKVPSVCDSDLPKDGYFG